jgi:predicted DNA-binding ribbon-helix-helix protein
VISRITTTATAMQVNATAPRCSSRLTRFPPAFMQSSPVVSRSIVIAGRTTSVILEYEFWKGLKEIATQRFTNLTALISKIDSQREHDNLSSAIRIFVLNFYRSQVSNRESGERLHETIDRRPLMHS